MHLPKANEFILSVGVVNMVAMLTDIHANMYM